MSRLIDADALIADLKHDIEIDQDCLDHEELTDINRKHIQYDKDCKQNAIDFVTHTPTIEERKTGKWILHPEQEKNIFGVKTIECSECGDKCLVQFVEKEKYCRNCGAKMER